MIPWRDFGRLRCNNASLLHAFATARSEVDRQLTSAMGLNNKVHSGGNVRAPPIFTPGISQVEATGFAGESGSYFPPMYSHGDGDSWPSFSFSPEQMDYRQASVSVPESTPSTPPLRYDTVTLGPMIDCSGVADLILDKVSVPFEEEKETTSSTRMILPPPASVTGNVTHMSPGLPLDSYGTLKHASVSSDSLLQTGKDDQGKKSNFLPGGANWEACDRDRVQQVVDPCANSEQRKTAVMHAEYLKNYRKGRHPNAVTLQKSDHMRRERDRRIALKLMYKTLDSLLPRPPKKSKRDRTAIVDDALKYVKGLQEKLEKLRGKGIGDHRRSSRQRLLDPGHESLTACSTSELPRCSGDSGREQRKKFPVFSEDQECIEANTLLLEPKVDVFIECGNEVLIHISCRPRSKLVSCVSETLELLRLDVQQYSFSKLLEELVHCNFRAKQKEPSGETPTKQMIEEILKSLLR